MSKLSCHAAIAVLLMTCNSMFAQFSLELPKPIRNTPLDPNTWRIPHNEVKFFGEAGKPLEPTSKFVTGCGAVLEPRGNKQWFLKYDNNGPITPFQYAGAYFAGRGIGYIHVFKFNGNGNPPYDIHMISISHWGGNKDSKGNTVNGWGNALSKYYGNSGKQVGVFHDGWWGNWQQ